MSTTSAFTVDGTPSRSARPSLISAQSFASTTQSNSERKRQLAPMNGEVKIVRGDLAKLHETPTKRIDKTVGKVQEFAESEPDLEQKMQGFLLSTKERGNYSFSKEDERRTLDETDASKDPNSLSMSAIEQAPSQCALLCEAISALECSKAAGR